MLPLLLAAFATVFTAELVGDKLLYTLTALATRYRPLPMLCGIGLAFTGKMGAAVLLGGLVAHLPAKLVVGLSAATFFTMALVLSFKASGEETRERGPSPHWSRAAVVAFSAVFFSEWGDPGQIAAAVLAARYQAPLIVWVGGTLAMVTKAILAITVGIPLRNRLPEGILRYCGVSLLFSLGVLSLLRLHES